MLVSFKVYMLYLLLKEELNIKSTMSTSHKRIFYKNDSNSSIRVCPAKKTSFLYCKKYKRFGKNGQNRRVSLFASGKGRYYRLISYGGPRSLVASLSNPREGSSAQYFSSDSDSNSKESGYSSPTSVGSRSPSPDEYEELLPDYYEEYEVSGQHTFSSEISQEDYTLQTFWEHQLDHSDYCDQELFEEDIYEKLNLLSIEESSYYVDFDSEYISTFADAITNAYFHLESLAEESELADIDPPSSHFSLGTFINPPSPSGIPPPPIKWTL